MIQVVALSCQSGTGKGEYAISPDVVFLQIDDGSARLLDLGGEFFAVPATGAEMLRGVVEQGTAATVCRLAAEYGVGEERIRADLDILMHKLEARGLIYSLGKGRPRRSCGGLASLIVLSWLRQVLRSRRSWQKKAGRLMTLARLSFRFWGWARTVSLWKECLPESKCQVTAEEEEETVRAIDEAIRAAAAGHLLEMACKERALCCWALIRSAGVPAKLVVGINLFPLAGHCWCEGGSRTLSDFPDRCATYTPVVRYE